jgi:DNA-binding NarL/FixJ family response regulator
MVVDDQAPFRSVARSLVAITPGLEFAAEAETGEQAVNLAESLHPRVVLMDINLPGISGIEATRRLCAADPTTKVRLAVAPADSVDLTALHDLAVGHRREDTREGAASN